MTNSMSIVLESPVTSAGIDLRPSNSAITRRSEINGSAPTANLPAESDTAKAAGQFGGDPTGSPAGD